MSKGVVEIHGNEYKTVAYRVNTFRREDRFFGYGVETEILNASDLVLVRAVVRNDAGRIVATGHAEEMRGSTNINKTSAIENAETSAVGRALAFTDGELAGTEIASADETIDAMAQQVEKDVASKHVAHMRAVKDNWLSMVAIKQGLSEGDYDAAFEAYNEISDDDKHALTLAPTKGGVWEVGEYKQLRSNEWTAARKRYFGQASDE